MLTTEGPQPHHGGAEGHMTLLVFLQYEAWIASCHPTPLLTRSYSLGFQKRVSFDPWQTAKVGPVMKGLGAHLALVVPSPQI